MKLQLCALALLGALLVSVLAPLHSAQAARPSGTLSTPVTGTTAAGYTFTGALNITKFAVQYGQLVTVGTLTGTLTSALGGLIGNVTQAWRCR